MVIFTNYCIFLLLKFVNIDQEIMSSNIEILIKEWYTIVMLRTCCNVGDLLLNVIYIFMLALNINKKV